MCCCGAACCRTKSATCICAVVVIHALLAVTLVAALFTRFYVHTTYEIGDMPSDTRVLLSAESSIFCSSYIAKSYIMDGATSQRVRNEHEINSNSIPEFDFYAMKDNPLKTNTPVTRSNYSMEGFSSLVSGGYEFNHFRFLNGSVMKIRMCSELVSEDTEPRPRPSANTTTDLLVFVVEGIPAFTDLQSRLNAGGFAFQGHRCPPYFKVRPSASATCENPSSKTNYSNFEIVMNKTTEHYVVIYNPDTKWAGQKYRIRYDLERYEYDLSNESAIATRTRSVQADPKLFLLLKFQYSRNSTFDKLYNIGVDYICEANVMVYIAVFFFVPLALVIVFGICLLCCYERHSAAGMAGPLLGSSSSRVNLQNTDWVDDVRDGSRGYGSTEAAYS